jgi:hypothetical protein
MSSARRVRAFPLYAVWVLAIFSGREAIAQEDFRSLDAGRPLKVTDAYPKKYLEWEFQFGLQGRWTEGGQRLFQGLLSLETGLFRNFEIGAGLQVATEPDAVSTTNGIESLEFEALYNFRHEGWTWPAVAIQVGAEAPTGSDLSREDWAWGADLLLTRSFANRFRIHVNGGYALVSEVDGDNYWRGGVAFDIPMGFSSRLIMGDLYAEIPAYTGPTRTWAELGTRVQVTNLTVIDLGLTTRLDEWSRGLANVRVVMGFSRVFGFGGLVRVPEYPNPRIR